MKKIFIISMIFLSSSTHSGILLKSTCPDADKSILMIKKDIENQLNEQIKKNPIVINKEGYTENYDNDNYIDYMFTIKDKAQKEILINKNSIYGNLDTHLKGKISDIKLAFPFFWVHKNSFAFSAIYSYIEGKGWTGIREFFIDPEIGTCHFSYGNIEVEKNSIYYDYNTEHEINGLSSRKSIEGNKNNGFVYNISWFSKDSRDELECVNKKFDKNIMDRMLYIARDISRQVNNG